MNAIDAVFRDLRSRGARAFMRSSPPAIPTLLPLRFWPRQSLTPARICWRSAFPTAIQSPTAGDPGIVYPGAGPGSAASTTCSPARGDC